jgi:Erv1 / Alr family
MTKYEGDHKRFTQIITDLALEILSKQNTGNRESELLSAHSKEQAKLLSEAVFVNKLSTSDEFIQKLMGFLSPFLYLYKPLNNEIPIKDYKLVNIGQTLFNFMWLLTFEVQNTVKDRNLILGQVTPFNVSGIKALNTSLEETLTTAARACCCVEFMLNVKGGHVTDSFMKSPGVNGEKITQLLKHYNVPGLSENLHHDLYELFYLQNIDPDIWGSKLWLPLHLITEAMASSNCFTVVEKWRLFLLKLSSVLPCEFCKSHWRNIAKENKIRIKTCPAIELPQLLYELHNKVRRNLGKSDYLEDDFRIDRFQFNTLLKSFVQTE